MLIQNSRGSVWRKWDLHLHSTASDGKNTPQELVEEAVKQNISVIALTDHHTVNNLDEIKRIGREKGIGVIAGIEFRTEYGQKSVHMIGLFPDTYEGTELNQKTLYDRILCKLDLSESDIIDAARKSGKHFTTDEAAFREGLLLVQVDFKRTADLIHKYGGVVTVHAGSKANSFEEEMRHEGKGAKNVSLADSLGPVKEELLNNYIDICEVRVAKEAPFYLERFGKPSIAASDAHSIDEFARHFSWIKAEPTFEGLKQIIFEPQSRVRIQQEEPEHKSDYLVIDSVEIDHEDFGKQTIPFNQGLNTIIGGRSSGKSILLGCIARLCGNNLAIKKTKPDYDDYIAQITKSMSITWRDHASDGNRKIDYFPQSRIIDVASNLEEVSKLAVSLLQSSEEGASKIAELQEFALTQERDIYSLFLQYKAVLMDKNGLDSELESLGNKEGIVKEIDKLRRQINEVKASMSETMSAEEESILEQQKNYLVRLRGICERTECNANLLNRIREVQLLACIDNQLLGLDEQMRGAVTNIYNDIRDKAQNAWRTNIDGLIAEQEQNMVQLTDQIQKIECSAIYKRAQALYSKNQELVVYTQREAAETKRLEIILRKEKEIEDITLSLEELKERLMQAHSRFYEKSVEFCDGVRMERDGIRIQPYITFEQERYYRLVSVALDGRATVNQELLQYQCPMDSSYTDFIKKTFIGLFGNAYVLRKGFVAEELAEQLITLNAFSIKYNIQYQGDDLNSMSEGKMAFVILRLLLDFSDSDYPILIDQPEDDLDNRAIYTELVKYLRSKKEQRQIILVTHNPNIVVGADAEEIIVANQHGVNNLNPENVKFAYCTGPLEESFRKAGEFVLLRNGIKEQVCDLLEGGDDAFRVRENKYNL